MQYIYINIKNYSTYCKNSLLKKQKAHGPYRSPEKQFQSINTFAQSYDTITLIKREKNHCLLY